MTQSSSANAIPAALLEFSASGQQLGRAGGEGKSFAFQELIRALLSIAFDQLGFVVEQVEIRRRAGEVKVNDPLGSSGELRGPRRERVVRLGGGDRGLRFEQRRQSNGTEAQRRVFQKMPAGDVLQVLQMRTHDGPDFFN
jgi:hypothetical protein